ncbi:MAG: hypothetical protein ACRD8W_06760 [Nitrososphaeraceae archaeon]
MTKHMVYVNASIVTGIIATLAVSLLLATNSLWASVASAKHAAHLILNE